MACSRPAYRSGILQNYYHSTRLPFSYTEIHWSLYFSANLVQQCHELHTRITTKPLDQVCPCPKIWTSYPDSVIHSIHMYPASDIHLWEEFLAVADLRDASSQTHGTWFYQLLARTILEQHS
jgi:hypothetical protein